MSSSTTRPPGRTFAAPRDEPWGGWRRPARPPGIRDLPPAPSSARRPRPRSRAPRRTAPSRRPPCASRGRRAIARIPSYRAFAPGTPKSAGLADAPVRPCARSGYWMRARGSPAPRRRAGPGQYRRGPRTRDRGRDRGSPRRRAPARRRVPQGRLPCGRGTRSASRGRSWTPMPAGSCPLRRRDNDPRGPPRGSGNLRHVPRRRSGRRGRVRGGARCRRSRTRRGGPANGPGVRPRRGARGRRIAETIPSAPHVA